MPNRSSTNLVPVHRSILDLAALAQYRKLSGSIQKAREKYYRVHQQVLKIANLYFDADERRNTVIRLRREIRLATRGTPAMIAQDSITAAGYFSNGTEQLYNAETELLGAAYRAVRKYVHPDYKYGTGDREIFQLVNTAYMLRDLTFLQETYVKLVSEHDLFWCTTKGLAYAMQEMERPNVSLKILQSTPEFRISQLHMTGNRDSAASAASFRMAELVVKLNAELQHLLNPPLEHPIEKRSIEESPTHVGDRDEEDDYDEDGYPRYVG